MFPTRDDEIISLDEGLAAYDDTAIYSLLESYSWPQYQQPGKGSEPPIPQNLDTFDIPQLRKMLTVYASWYEYVYNQRAILEALVINTEAALKEVEAYLAQKVYNNKGGKDRTEQIKLHKAYVELNSKYIKLKATSSALSARVDKLRTIMDVINKHIYALVKGSVP